MTRPQVVALPASTAAAVVVAVVPAAVAAAGMGCPSTSLCRAVLRPSGPWLAITSRTVVVVTVTVPVPHMSAPLQRRKWTCLSHSRQAGHQGHLRVSTAAEVLCSVATEGISRGPPWWFEVGGEGEVPSAREKDVGDRPIAAVVVGSDWIKHKGSRCALSALGS